MGRTMRRRIWLAVLVPLFAFVLFSQEKPSAAVISVDAAHPGAAISPTMFGIFFEDINFGADGGLYPELVKNRSFEFQEPLAGWHEVLTRNSKGHRQSEGGTRHPHRRPAEHVQSPLSQCPRLRTRLRHSGTRAFAASGLKADRSIDSPHMFEAADRKPSAPPSRTASGHEIGSGKLEGFDGHWKRYETVIRANATAPHAQLNLFIDETGSSRSRHGFAVPRGHLEKPPQRTAQRPGAIALRSAPGFHPLPRRLHRRGPPAADALSMEDDRRRYCADARPSSTAGTTNSITGRRRTIFNRSASDSMNTSNWRKTSAPSRCPF